MTTATSTGAGGGRATTDVSPFLLALFTETPLHPGTGQSTGIIDLPVQRERHTDFPIVPATSLKGSLRERAEQQWGKTSAEVAVLFGPPTQNASDHAGAVGFTDTRLLAFPVRSLSQVFLWVTCPLALGRLARDLQLTGRTPSGLSVPPAGPRRLRAAPDVLPDTVVLEDLSFEATPDQGWQALARRLATFLPEGSAHEVHRQKFQNHLVLIEDDDFRYLVGHATQVTARIALNDRKTTTGGEGNLWYEETIPADTLLYALVRPESPRATNPAVADAAAVRQRLLDLVAGDPFFLQVGGNETVGHGWCAVRTVERW